MDVAVSLYGRDAISVKQKGLVTLPVKVTKNLRNGRSIYLAV